MTEKVPLNHDQIVARIQKFYNTLCNEEIMYRDMFDLTKDEEEQFNLQNLNNITIRFIDEYLTLFEDIVV